MTPSRMVDLNPGAAVLANDGTRVATIRTVGQTYIVAESRRGSAVLHIPTSAVGSIQDGVVRLNVASHDVAGMGWDIPPRTEDVPESAPESDLHRHV